MNIKINRDALLKPLANVASIVERKHALPILSNILIQGKGGQVQLTATDLEMQVSLSFKAELKEEISTTISARKFFDITRSLPDDCVIDIGVKDSRVSVKANKSRFAIQTHPAKYYPVMTKSSSEAVVITISQIQLKRLLKQVEFAMAQQDIRYYLNGLLFEVNGNQLNIVGTDGHRLSFTSVYLDQNYNKTEVILPRKTVIELIKLLNDTEELVSVELYKGQVSFNFNDIQLISKVIDGKFPDYSRVIPQNQPKALKLNRVAFLQALQRAAILTSDKFRGVRWVLSDGVLKIICSNTEQEEAQEEIDVDYKGDSLDIGFNVGYMLDVLNNLAVEEVICGLGDASSSALITVPGQGDFKYVVMPMRI